MTKGIVYMVWGKYDKSLLKRSTDSAEKYGYKYVVRVLDVAGGLDNKRFIYEQSPFDICLFLDIDTVITGNLDYGFSQAEKYGIACCIAPASSAWQASRGDIKDLIDVDMPQINTGVIFFDKWNSTVEYIFKEWKRLMEEYPDSATNDQPYFSLALYDSLVPFILPRTWNWRRDVRYESQIIHGALKILHSRRRK